MCEKLRTIAYAYGLSPEPEGDFLTFHDLLATAPDAEQIIIAPCQPVEIFSLVKADKFRMAITIEVQPKEEGAPLVYREAHHAVTHPLPMGCPASMAEMTTMAAVGSRYDALRKAAPDVPIVVYNLQGDPICPRGKTTTTTQDLAPIMNIARNSFHVIDLAPKENTGVIVEFA